MDVRRLGLAGLLGYEGYVLSIGCVVPGHHQLKHGSVRLAGSVLQHAASSLLRARHIRQSLNIHPNLFDPRNTARGKSLVEGSPAIKQGLRLGQKGGHDVGPES